MWAMLPTHVCMLNVTCIQAIRTVYATEITQCVDCLFNNMLKFLTKHKHILTENYMATQSRNRILRTT